MRKKFLLILILFIHAHLNAQTAKKIKPTIWEGMAIAGYVNRGAFVNFGGPGIKLGHKPYSILFTMLPSLRLKEDRVPQGQKKNSFVTPSLGAGVTVGLNHVALQLPIYYNPKTAAQDGKWRLGLGVGYKF